MDKCAADVITEFLGVAFHNILYYSGIYPESVYTVRKKYNAPVYMSVHPEINTYIRKCLENISHLLLNGHIDQVDFALYEDSDFYLKFIFRLQIFQIDENKDIYLVWCEQKLRAFCLKLSNILPELRLGHNISNFRIFVHTDESSAVSLSTCPGADDFPFLEFDNDDKSCHAIPITHVTLKNNNLEIFLEK